MTKKKKNSLLWQISGKEMKGPSYFFGTMHVRDNRAFRGIDFLRSCIERCDSFAAEFDLREANHSLLQEATRIPNGKSLEDYLNPRVYKKLAGVVERETGLSLDNFKYSSPILLINVVSEAQFQAENDLALDSTLYNIAQDANKKLLGLETFEAQISVFGKVDLKGQCRSLKKLATNFRSFKSEIKKTAALYIQGDSQKLLKKAKRSIGGMRRVLLYERNETMAIRFEEFSAQQSLFAAVGAGHLGGQKGVLRLLKKKGYDVSPVFY